MYPFEVGAVVLVELVANALDSHATKIKIDYNQQQKTLIVTDNGKGMDKLSFDQYHDFAAGLKTRGTGIGFAGVGAKISFNIASRVITETKSVHYSAGSNWYLESNKRLVWEDIPVVELTNYGTRVKVIFKTDACIPFTCSQDIITLLKQHYFPLFDKRYLSLYNELSYYDDNLRFIVNNEIVEPGNVIKDYALENSIEFYPMSREKKIGFGIFGLSPIEYPIGDNICGVLLCTHGKVIKGDFFNQFPGDIGPKIFGIVEIPNLINYLTSSKTDFMRGRKYKSFDKLYDPIRKEFINWLKSLGIQTAEFVASDEALKLERELKKLIDDIPELSEFFGFRARQNVLINSTDGEFNSSEQDGAQMTFPHGEGNPKGESGVVGPGEEPGSCYIENPHGNKKANPISRRSRLGPKIAFQNSPERADMAWVDGNNIIINAEHPAYIKIRQNTTAKKVHCIHAIANAIQKFIVPDLEENLDFADRMLGAWGEKS